MKKIILKNEKIIFIILTIVFLSTLIYFYYSTISNLVSNFNQAAFTNNQEKTSTQFDFSGFQSLKLNNTQH